MLFILNIYFLVFVSCSRIKLDNMKAHLATFAKLVNSRDGKVHLGQTKKCLLKLRSSESEEILALCEKVSVEHRIRLVP